MFRHKPIPPACFRNFVGTSSKRSMTFEKFVNLRNGRHRVIDQLHEKKIFDLIPRSDSECVLFTGRCTLDVVMFRNSHNQFFDGKVGCIMFSKTGKITTVMFFDWMNQLHREDGPAFIRFNMDGEVFCERWHYHGTLHRTPCDQPVIIELHPKTLRVLLVKFEKKMAEEEKTEM